MKVVFTDLDGTLLEHETYSWAPARPALEYLARNDIPLIFCTSKTRAEVEVLRETLGNRHPFIVENGGGAFIPQGYFPFPATPSVQREAYDVAEFGTRYEELVETLCSASQASGTAVLGFHQMSAEEISLHCGLPIDEAELARRREYDEPFEIVDPARADSLLREIEKRGKRWTRGGRYYHITGNNDKAGAVRFLTSLYRRLYGTVVTVGLGDGLNDAEFLAVVDVPFLVRSRQLSELLKKVPHGRVTDQPGPAGWNRAILEMGPE